MKILVLGGKGYLGSKILPFLRDQGYYLIATSRDIRSSTPALESVEWIHSDMKSINECFDQHHPLWVVNMVADYGKKDEYACLEANFIFPYEVMRIGSKKGVSRFLTIGTSLPNYLNDYAFTKHLLDRAGEYLVSKKNISYTTLKSELFYGSDEPRGRFISGVIRDCKSNKPVVVTEGTQKRDIVAVGDVVRAVAFIIESDPIGFNEIPLGTGEGPRIRDIVKYIHEETRSQSTIVYGGKPMRDNEPDCIADVSVLKSMGFECRWKWKEGVKEMIKYIND